VSLGALIVCCIGGGYLACCEIAWATERYKRRREARWKEDE
jgi:hypothetical protein